MNRILLVIKGSSIYDFLIHIGIALFLSLTLLIWFINSYLPAITYHQETVTVPNIEGMSIEELEDFLDSRDLGFEVRDSVYSRNYPAYTVLTQSPEPGAKVKRYRKLFLTVNPRVAPKVKLPNLVNMPFSEARRTLRNAGLELGKVKYIPHIGENSILEQSIKGRKFSPETLELGIQVVKGSEVDLLIGDGVGEKEMKVPDLVLMPLDEAEFVIKGMELILGTITYDYNSSREIGTVLDQNPPVYIGTRKPGVKPGGPQDDRKRTTIRAGEIMDLRVAGNPAAKPEDYKELSEEEQERLDSLRQNMNIRERKDFEKYRKKQLGIEDKDKEKDKKPASEPKKEDS